MEQTAIERAVAAILFAAGEPVGASRMAMAAGVSEEEIHTAAQSLMSRWNYERFGIRIVRLEDAYQMCSSGEMADVVTKALETRKPPRLSPALLEALNSGKVKAAGLDVWMSEKDPNWALAQHPAVSCTPHIGAGTKEAQKRIGAELVDIVEHFGK